MGKISFIHLSDIHFNRSSGNVADIDSDLREAIIDDIKINAKAKLSDLQGVLVVGDIAFSGKSDEYEKSKDFLKRITDILGAKQNAVFCVPGNHDVDQSVSNGSSAVYEAQKKLDSAKSIDEADRIFSKQIDDKCYSDILFKPIQNYNEFASVFDCNIHAGLLNWHHDIELEHGMKLQLYGITSSFISNSDDHKYGERRLMYVGQAQIPSRQSDTIFMALCHHPPELWKFHDNIRDKINKRFDIQLYGHTHIQSMVSDDSKVIISSGAVQPVRDDDWFPRYNWITVECVIKDGKRAIKLEIYPRILSSDRDRFIIDSQSCSNCDHMEHILEIDKKRKGDLTDPISEQKHVSDDQNILVDIACVAQEGLFDMRELKFRFFSLKSLEQTKVLLELSLLDDEDKNMNYATIMPKIISKAKQTSKLSDLWAKINLNRSEG